MYVVSIVTQPHYIRPKTKSLPGHMVTLHRVYDTLEVLTQLPVTLFCRGTTLARATHTDRKFIILKFTLLLGVELTLKIQTS